MFNKRRCKGSFNCIDTLIGQHTHLKGNIGFIGGLCIEGSVEGNINAAGDSGSVLTLREAGNIEGEVRVCGF